MKNLTNHPSLELKNKNSKINTTHSSSALNGKNQKKHLKLKGIWRETQLSKPNRVHEKYVPPYESSGKPAQKSIEIPPEILLRSSHLAFTNLRIIQENKINYQHVLDEKRMKNLQKHEDKTTNSIYFRYRLQQMREQEKLQKQQERSLATGKKKMVNQETDEQKAKRWKNLIKPKEVPEPEDIDRGPIKSIEEMASRLAELAEPSKREELPSKSPWQINPAALTYVATENVIRLGQTPKRYEYIEPPLAADRPIPKSALEYKMTPRMEKLYTIKIRKEATVTPEEDVWKISPAALKYQPTQRIIAISKPINRP